MRKRHVDSHFVFVRFRYQPLKIQLGIHFFHNQHKKVIQETLDTNFYSEMLLPEYFQEYDLVYKINNHYSLLQVLSPRANIIMVNVMQKTVLVPYQPLKQLNANIEITWKNSELSGTSRAEVSTVILKK